MMLTYDLQKNSKREPKLSGLELTSLNLKRNLFIINITSILLATYFFIRHNDRCEGGSKSIVSIRSILFLLSSFVVYTFFALFEYIVVLTNMGYHMTAALEFHNQHLVFDWRHGLQIHYQ